MSPPLDFQLLFEASPDVLLVLLPDAPRFTMVAATEERLRATHGIRDEVIGKGLFELFPDNPDDVGATGTANLRASLERVVATRAPDTMAVQKYDIRGPDGTFEARYWSPKNLPVISPSGELLYILHRALDVTDLVRAHEVGEELRDRTRQMESEVISRSRELSVANRELRDANARLGELDAAKTDFFSNVSHELRTPLTLMLGPLEDALYDETAAERLGPLQRERIELAHDNALRLLKLVNALLDFSRLEAGRLRALYAPLDISELSAQLATMFSSAVSKAGLRLAIDCPPLREPAYVDRDMWEKIVPNLVSNAFKYTLEGEIAVRVREERAGFVLEVADTGVGIPEAERPRIFERFHRVGGTVGRTHEGTGIGLSLVRELVELHGGRITVDSEVGRGSTFRVSIPKGSSHLPPDAVSDRPAPRIHDRSAGAHAIEAARWAGRTGGPTPSEGAPPTRASAGPRPRVLVVDDSADLRNYIATLLAPAYDVSTASDGLDALAQVRASRPDLVVSDVMMPRLDGPSMVRAVRADPDIASTPVILLSARAGEDAAVEGLDSGADDYLIKPFSASELFARARTHIELARARRAWVSELEARNREIEEASRAKSRFLANMSHELRTPLNAIIGFSELLRDRRVLPSSPRYDEFLSHVLGSARHLLQLINDVLDLSKVEAGKLDFHPEPLDLGDVVREAISSLGAIASSKQIEVGIRELEVDRAVLDRARLKQVLYNYLSNALKFTPERGTVTVSVRAESASSFRLEVADTGIGIAESDLAKLFTEFQQLDPSDSRQHGGTGLGLALTRRLVEEQGGSVGARSRVGEGSVFYAVLPRGLAGSGHAGSGGGAT